MDPPAVGTLLRQAGLRGPVKRWEVLGGGYANDLWRLHLPSGTAVLRAWRRDPGRATVELAVMDRASPVVPVPAVLAAELNGDRPLALLEDVPGVRADQALVESPDDAERIGAALGEAFGRLHAIRFARPGFFPDASLTPAGWPPGTPAEQLLNYARPRVWSGAARAALGPEVQGAWWALIEAGAPALEGLGDEATLVHADATPRNVLLRRTPAGWQVAAVLDWEFSLSGPGLMDLGALICFEPRAGSPFADGVLRGWQAGGGATPPDFKRIAHALDVFSMANVVTAPDSAPHGAVVELVRRCVHERQL